MGRRKSRDGADILQPNNTLCVIKSWQGSEKTFNLWKKKMAGILDEAKLWVYK